jgi:hypothetical protein
MHTTSLITVGVLLGVFVILWRSDMRAMLLGAAAGAMLSVCVPLRAAPPEHADPGLAPWFQTLLQPDTGVSCCSIADCRVVDSRVGPAGYEVLLEDEWLPVPKEKILDGKHNPIGRAVVCASQAMGILCFVRGTEI